MMSVGLFEFPDMEILDFAGPYQVFDTAARLSSERSGKPRFHLVSIGATTEPIRVSGGATCVPEASIADHPKLDCLLLPGGLTGVDAQIERPEVIDWVTAAGETTGIIASIGTGAFLLAQTGALTGFEATTHHAHTDDLRRRFPGIDVVTNRRWVDTGQYVTSAGSSAGIDMAVHLVERLAGRDLAVATARSLEL